MVDTAERDSFDGWYRSEHPRLLALLTVAAGDADVGREITSEAFVRALERWDRVEAMVCDLPQEEIASVMQVAPGTVSATLTAARRRLAAELNPVEVRLD